MRRFVTLTVIMFLSAFCLTIQNDSLETMTAKWHETVAENKCLSAQLETTERSDSLSLSLSHTYTHTHTHTLSHIHNTHTLSFSLSLYHFTLFRRVQESDRQNRELVVLSGRKQEAMQKLQVQALLIIHLFFLFFLSLSLSPRK